MQLLSPTKVKQDERDGAEEKRKRSILAAKEEARIVKRLNALRDAENAEEQRRTSNANQASDIRIVRDSYKSEVRFLQTMRSDALKPIEGLRKEAERLLEESKNEQLLVVSQENLLKQKEENIRERMERISDIEDEINSRLSDVKSKESKAEKASDVLKLQAQSIADKWVEFYSASEKRIAELNEREKRTALDAKANQEFLKTIEERTKEQNNRDIQLKDRYDTLQKATDEVRKKYNLKI
jgi:DNA repair exonuclease SbcCD ATPase subunit